MFTTIIKKITEITQGLALIIMFSMMVFVFIGVTSRAFYKPVIGDVELVQLGMVVLIMCGLAYTERVNGHISIGLLVDKFPIKVQLILDVIGSLLNVFVAVVISYVFIFVAMNHYSNMRLSTEILSIPYFPFDFLIAFGFALWALEALLKLTTAVQQLLSNRKEAK